MVLKKDLIYSDSYLIKTSQESESYLKGSVFL